MDVFDVASWGWAGSDGNAPDPSQGLQGSGPNDELIDVTTVVDFGHGARSAVIEFDFIELDRWDGERFSVQIGDDTLDLGRFWHDRADAVVSGAIDGQAGRIIWTVHDAFANEALGGNAGFADEQHFVRIVAEGLQGRQVIGFGATLDEAATQENWRVDGLRVSLDLGASLADLRTITDFDGGVEWAGATGARHAEISGVRSAWQGTMNWYDVFANGDGAWGHGDYWLNLGRLGGGSINLSDATTLKIDAIQSGAEAPMWVYVRDAGQGWVHVGQLAPGETTLDLTALPNNHLDQLNAMVLRIHERDMTATPDQTAWTRVHLNDISYEVPLVGVPATGDGAHDLGALIVDGAVTIPAGDLLAGADDAARVVWVGNGLGGTPEMDGDIRFAAEDGHSGAAGFDYIVSDGQGDFVRHRAVFDLHPVLRSSDIFADAGPDGTVVIGAGQRVLLDADAEIGTLIIDGGELIAEDAQDIHLAAGRVLVMDGGLFQVGTEDDLFRHRFTLELTGDDPGHDTFIAPYRDMPMGPDWIEDNDAYLMAMGMGSRIEIHAADALKEGWTQLDATAEAGDVWLKLSEATGWEAGDRIAIASTEFDMDEAEVRIIVEVRDGGREVRLDRALDHRHFGEIETYDNGKAGGEARSWQIDMRAEVALLSRNVTITGDENAHLDRFGGHIMVMHHGDMRIEGAEITRMGQEGILGRYGAHWHLSGDAAGDYLKNNSFHQIYNKGITWHGVQNTVVSDNVVFETIGHSYFMEDGAEFGNRITGNLGFGTRAVDPGKALTSADIDHVSTFWIENPNNVIEGNHAAGSEFAGFWIAPSNPHGLSAATGLYDGLTGRTDPIQHFVGNTAHSNAFNLGIEGHVGDGPDMPRFHNSRYEATADWEICDFTAFKSDDRSIWTRALGGVFADIKSADNTRATFFSYTNTMQDSVIVGRSEGNGQATGGPLGHRGHSIYDGPSGIEDVHFVNFDGLDRAIQLNTAAEKSTTHFARGITFDGVAEANRVDFKVVGFAENGDRTAFDHAWTTSLIDLDGSITGTARATITAMIDGPEGSKVNVSPDAVARPDWNAWVGTGAEIGWMRIVPSTDFPSAEATSGENVSTWYDIFRSDGEQILNARPTNDVVVNAGFAVQDDLSYRVRLHELPTTMKVVFNGLSQGTSFFYTFENLPSETTVTRAAEVASRAALEAATATAFYRDNNDLVFKVVAERPYHLTPETDDAYMLGRTHGAFFTIDTGLPNDSANVLADFERGVDVRGQTIATAATIGPARAAWQDRDDSINWWDVTANGDGRWGHGDYHLRLGETQDWTPFTRLSIATILGGVKAGYEVILHDATDGEISVGRFDAGMARIYLDDVDARFLDEVDDIVIRVHERDLTGSAANAGAFTRIHLQGVYLEGGDGPRFDFDKIGETVTTVGARNVALGDTRSQVGAGDFGANVLEVAANGDGVFGYGDLQFSVNNENWQGQDWIRIDTAISGLQPDYTLYLRDKQDGWVKIGTGGSGRAHFDLSQVTDRHLDHVDRVMLRVQESDLAADPLATSDPTRIELKAIDALRGRITLADYERGVDARGITEAEGVSVSAVRAAWQDQEDSINYWDVTANGDGQWGHSDYRLGLETAQDLSPFRKLTIDATIGGVRAGYDVLVHDATDGYVHVGRFGPGLSRIYLDEVDARFLDEVDEIVIRVHERDLADDASDAGASTRIHLFGVYLDGGPRFDFDEGVERTAFTASRDATVSELRHGAGLDGDGVVSWDVAANGDGAWGHGDMMFRINNEDWRAEDWLQVNTTISGADSGYTVFLRDSDEGWVNVGHAGSGTAYFDLGGIESDQLDQIDAILFRVEERDLASDASSASGGSTINLKSIDTLKGPVTVADFDGGVDPRGELVAVNAAKGRIGTAWGDTINWWDAAADGDGVSGYLDYRLTVDAMDLTSFSSLDLSGVIGGILAPYELLVRDRESGLTSLGRHDTLNKSLDLRGTADHLIDSVDQFIFRVHEADLQTDPASNLGRTRMHLDAIELS